MYSRKKLCLSLCYMVLESKGTVFSYTRTVNKFFSEIPFSKVEKKINRKNGYDTYKASHCLIEGFFNWIVQ